LPSGVKKESSYLTMTPIIQLLSIEKLTFGSTRFFLSLFPRFAPPGLTSKIHHMLVRKGWRNLSKHFLVFFSLFPPFFSLKIIFAHMALFAF
jgi:hypothetical protein